jgi:hypothetical protein
VLEEDAGSGRRTGLSGVLDLGAELLVSFNGATRTRPIPAPCWILRIDGASGAATHAAERGVSGEIMQMANGPASQRDIATYIDVQRSNQPSPDRSGRARVAVLRKTSARLSAWGSSTRWSTGMRWSL